MAWLSENISSIIILTVTVGIVALLIFGMIREKKAAKASGKPGCCGCPYSKTCGSSATPCSCNKENFDKKQ